MGHKVNPVILRTGHLLTWSSRWFAKKDYPRFLRQDLEIRKFLAHKLKNSGLAQVMIERTPATMTVIMHAAKPGMIIGRGGQGVEDLKQEIVARFLPPTTNLTLTIQEVPSVNLSAELVVRGMVADLEKRLPFRRVLKQALARVERAGALGVRVMVAGRLNGAEIARTEKLTWGRMPLHTLRAHIDYSRSAAFTTYGTIGVKVWIYTGERFAEDLSGEKIGAEMPAVRRPR